MNQNHADALNDLELGQHIPVKTPKFEFEVNSEGGSFTNYVSNEPIKRSEYQHAFDRVYELAGLDPEEFRIVDDTVRFSSWQQSARAKSGDRDVITLFAYSARFQRISEMSRALEESVARVSESIAARRKNLKRNIKTPGTGLGPSVAATGLPSDWQFGKPEIREEDLEHGATGVEQTSWRIERFLDRFTTRIKAERKAGLNVDRIAIGFMGDPIENVSNSYINQGNVIEKGLNDQLFLALDHMSLICEELFPYSDEAPIVFAVLCNHGQLTRQHSKTNVTGDEDNAQNLLMRLLRDYTIGRQYPGVEWHVPHDNMITTLDIAGVPVSAAHGHKIPGGASGEANWLSKQTNLLAQKQGHLTRLWLTAHRHSHDLKDYGPYHRLQAATAEGGSKHYSDGSGGYSTPGTSTVFIGNHSETGFSGFERL